MSTIRHRISCHFTVKQNITKDLLHFTCICCHYHHLTPDTDGPSCHCFYIFSSLVLIFPLFPVAFHINCMSCVYSGNGNKNLYISKTMKIRRGDSSAWLDDGCPASQLKSAICWNTVVSQDSKLGLKFRCFFSL